MNWSKVESFTVSSLSLMLYKQIFHSLAHRFFMNTRIENDRHCEVKLAEAYCEITLRTLSDSWMCNEKIPTENQYYNSEKLYYPESSYFKDGLHVPLEDRDKLFMKLFDSVKFKGSMLNFPYLTTSNMLLCHRY